MAVLEIHNISDSLLMEIGRMAKENNLSVDDQVIKILSETIEFEINRQRQAKTIESLHNRRFIPPDGKKSSTELLREDRNR